MKLKEMKQKIAENKEDIAFWSIVASGFVIYAGIVVLNVKAQNRYNAEVEARRKMLVDAINRGATILPNTDGSFWILDPIK